MDPGNLVSPGMSTPLVSISSLTPMRVDFNVSEIDYLRFITRTKSPAVRREAAQRLSLSLLLPDGTTYPHPGKFYMAGTPLTRRPARC